MRVKYALTYLNAKISLEFDGLQEEEEVFVHITTMRIFIMRSVSDLSSAQTYFPVFDLKVLLETRLGMNLSNGVLDNTCQIRILMTISVRKEILHCLTGQKQNKKTRR